MFAVTREQQDAAYVVIQQEEARVQAEADAASAKRGAAEAAYLAEVAAWKSQVEELLDEGYSLFGTDEASQRVISGVIANREEAREKKARDEREELRRFYAGLSNFGVSFYAVSRGLFLYLPLCVVLALFLELARIPTVFAVTIACVVLINMTIKRFYWIKRMGLAVPDLPEPETSATKSESL